jgi:hypothetical protein
MQPTPTSLNRAAPFAPLMFAADLQPAAPIHWIWHGLLAPGCVTLLTSQWKSGKSTLLAVLLSKRRAGGELAGLAVRPGQAVVLSEEHESLWRMRHGKLDLCGHQFICRPFVDMPDRAAWCAMLESVAKLAQQQPFDLLVIDTIIRFLPCYAENDAVAIAQCMADLRQVAHDAQDAGHSLSILLNHHPRKDESKEGQAARGSGALGSQVDIVLEMHPVTSLASADRRRWLHGFSRFEETPRRLLLELNAAGNDYAAMPVESAVSADDVTLLNLLRGGPLSLKELAAAWPTDHPCPDATTLRRRLDRLADRGLVFRHGSGRRGDACRYEAAAA